MAIIKLNVFSKSLYRNVDIQVILPVDNFSLAEETPLSKGPFKTLYLLHGVFGDSNDWITNTRIALWAQQKNLCVVMPSGENMFYLNAPGINGQESDADVGGKYSDFIGKELVELTRTIFPLSKKREDTFIGGLSMGGYGALINGLKYHSTFSHIAALSPALMLDDAVNSTYSKNIILRNRAFFESFFGDLSKVLDSEKNPYTLVSNLRDAKVELPKMYLACGKNDHLFKRTEDFADFLMTKGTDFIFEKGNGNHDWDFWDTYIKRVLEWLPL